MMPEYHRSGRTGWLRAAVLGANDGLLSTASLILGVAAAGGTRRAILIAAVAGMVSGAMSMAAGEYVSVSSQHDAERADLARESREQQVDPAGEHEELAQIYRDRGVDQVTAAKVANEMMAKDALAAHARDELGFTLTNRARPVQAALTSAVCFALGAMVPVILALLPPAQWMVGAQVAGALLMLILLGAIGAAAGGAPVWRGAARVTLWGALALAVTAGIGRMIGAVL